MDGNFIIVEKLYIVLNEDFRCLTQLEILTKNPMNSVPVIKKQTSWLRRTKGRSACARIFTFFTPEESK